MKRTAILLTLLGLFISAPSHAQQVNLYCNTGSGMTAWQPASAGAPCPVTATFPVTGIGVDYLPSNSATFALAPGYVSTAAESGHASVCGAACNLYTAYAANVGAASLWLMVFDSATVPSNGTVAPKDFVPVPVGASTGITYAGMPMQRMATDLSVACSSTAPPTLTLSPNCMFKVMSK